MKDTSHTAPGRVVALPVAPHSVEAEQSVLGGLLLNNSAISSVRDVVDEADFYRGEHRIIYKHIVKLLDRGEPADILTVDESLKNSTDRDDTGGFAYLGLLVQSTPSAHNIRRYAEIVHEHALRRAVIAVGVQLQTGAMSPGADVHELRRHAEGELTRIKLPGRTVAALDWADLALQEPPERSWAMLMWIAMNAPTLLVGAGGTGKTLLMLQLGACLALAHRFVDDIPVARRVLLWCCEDDADELWRRMVAIARWMQVDLAAFADKFFIVPRLGLDNTLFCSEYGRPIFTPAFEELKAQASDVGAEVVLLDNVAQLFGGDENDRHDVTSFMNGLVGAHRHRAVILAAHPARAQGSEFSGSGAWENAVRTRLYLGRTMPDQRDQGGEEGDDTVRYFARRKANYSARDYRRLILRDGVLVPEEVTPAGGPLAGIYDRRADQVVLQAMAKLASMGLHMKEGANSPQYLPRLVLEYKLAEGCSKSELATAMRRLMVEGKIVTRVVGQYTNRSPKHGLQVVQ